MEVVKKLDEESEDRRSVGRRKEEEQREGKRASRSGFYWDVFSIDAEPLAAPVVLFGTAH